MFIFVAWLIIFSFNFFPVPLDTSFIELYIKSVFKVSIIFSFLSFSYTKNTRIIITRFVENLALYRYVA